MGRAYVITEFLRTRVCLNIARPIPKDEQRRQPRFRIALQGFDGLTQVVQMVVGEQDNRRERVRRCHSLPQDLSEWQFMAESHERY